MDKSFLKRKQSFIITAIQILDELGVTGLTTREIAKREGVTEPALYRQFKSKDEVIVALIEELSKYDEYIINTVQENEMGFMEGILYYAKVYAEYYQGYSQIVSVIYAIDYYKNNSEAKKKMETMFERRYNFLKNFIEKAKERNEISFEISSDQLADIISGTIHSITYFWKNTDSSQNLKEKIENALKFILR